MDNKYHPEYKSVTWSVAVLCASLLLVYLVLYLANGEVWKGNIGTCKNSTGDVEIAQLGDNSIMTGLDQSSSYFMQKDNDNSSGDIVKYDSGIESVVELDTGFSSDTDSGILVELNNKNIYTGGMRILSGTKTYYGVLDFVEKLGISYKYALVDDKGIYYLNMGDYKYDYSDIARKLGGNLYIMNTEQELLANGMFGDKVTYINVPEYKNTKVLILLDIDDQSWLLAIDYSIYHQVKSYLKSLFITTS